MNAFTKNEPASFVPHSTILLKGLPNPLDDNGATLHPSMKRQQSQAHSKTEFTVGDTHSSNASDSGIGHAIVLTDISMEAQGLVFTYNNGSKRFTPYCNVLVVFSAPLLPATATQGTPQENFSGAKSEKKNSKTKEAKAK